VGAILRQLRALLGRLRVLERSPDAKGE
jgi:hypothetical protein